MCIRSTTGTLVPTRSRVRHRYRPYSDTQTKAVDEAAKPGASEEPR